MDFRQAASEMEDSGLKEGILDMAYRKGIPDHDIYRSLLEKGHDHGLDDEGLVMGQIIDEWVLEMYEEVGLRQRMDRFGVVAGRVEKARAYLQRNGVGYIDSRVICRAFQRWGMTPRGRGVPDIDIPEQSYHVKSMSDGSR